MRGTPHDQQKNSLHEWCHIFPKIWAVSLMGLKYLNLSSKIVSHSNSRIFFELKFESSEMNAFFPKFTGHHFRFWDCWILNPDKNHMHQLQVGIKEIKRSKSVSGFNSFEQIFPKSNIFHFQNRKLIYFSTSFKFWQYFEFLFGIELELWRSFQGSNSDVSKPSEKGIKKRISCLARKTPKISFSTLYTLGKVSQLNCRESLWRERCSKSTLSGVILYMDVI